MPPSIYDDRVFPAGTWAECNRCGKLSRLPKDCAGHRETMPGSIFRLDTMCLLDCGHMDAHWVNANQPKEAISNV